MSDTTGEATFNFTDAQGRCYIAGTEVPREVYDEFETAWARVATLERGIESYLNRGWYDATAEPHPRNVLRALLDTSHDQERDDE